MIHLPLWDECRQCSKLRTCTDPFSPSGQCPHPTEHTLTEEHPFCNQPQFNLTWNEVTSRLSVVGKLLEARSHLPVVAQALTTMERFDLNDDASRWVNYQWSQYYRATGQINLAITRMERVVAIDVRQKDLPKHRAWSFPLEDDRRELADLQALLKGAPPPE